MKRNIFAVICVFMTFTNAELSGLYKRELSQRFIREKRGQKLYIFIQTVKATI